MLPYLKIGILELGSKGKAMNRAFHGIFLMNILAVFVLIILCLALTLLRQPVLTVKGLFMPVESRIEKNFFYMELDRNFVIPVGFGGECDKRFYRKINYGSDLLLCVPSKDFPEKQKNFLNYHEERSVFKEELGRLHPSSDYVVLLVRPSAFGFYHEVAEKILSMGFEVGWFPLDSQRPVAFSSKGKLIGRQ